MDRVMLEWERRHPHDGYVVGALLRLRGRRPTRERLVDWMAARAPLVPVLAEHLDGPARQERWAPFESFDIARHVHVADDLRSLSAGEWAVNLRVPADRPRWGLWLLPGSDDDGEDGYTLVYRVHHAAQDGVAAGQTLERLFAGEAPAAPAVALPPGGLPDPVAPGTGLVMAVADVPAPALSEIAREAGCSRHDVYLGALAGALRAWRGAGGREGSVPVRMPFSVRLPSERQDRGNRVGHARILLPVDEPSAGRRLALIAGQTAAWKADSARERTRRIQDRMSAGMSEHMLLEEFSAFPDADDSLATATSVRIGRPLAFDGDPVTGITGLPPLYGGHLFTSLLCGYGTRATVCFTARAQDRQVLDLAPLWENAVGELATARR
jgi:diacylglycerol O-acyltransferase